MVCPCSVSTANDCHCISSSTNDKDQEYADCSAEPGASHPGLEKCMELKTNGPITNANQERTFHKYIFTLDPPANPVPVQLRDAATDRVGSCSSTGRNRTCSVYL